MANQSRYTSSHSLHATTSSMANVNSNSKKKRIGFLRRKTQSESWSVSKTAETEEAEREVTPADVDEQANEIVTDKRRESTADTSLPSASTLKDLERVIRLIEQERHLVAYDLYTSVKARLYDWSEARDVVSVKSHDTEGREKKSHGIWRRRGRKNKDLVNNEEAVEKPVDLSQNEEAYKLWSEKWKEFEALEKRATMFQTARQNLTTPTSWTLAQTLFGITTHYRREADNTLSIKIEGELHGLPLFEQMVVLRECDLYHTWAPFCNASRKLAQLDKLDVVAWYCVGTPMLGMVRDACYRAVGCDCMREDGSVLLVAVGLGDDGSGDSDENDSEEEDDEQQQQQQQHQSKETEQRDETQQIKEGPNSSTPIINTNATSFLARDSILSTIALPPVPTAMGHGRMTIRNFSASITVLGASSARTRMVVNVDPNLHFLPQSIIDFCMKRMCGVLLARLQVAARKVLKDPVKNPHARRMREDVRFYRDWLLPKFRTYCDELGWLMPPVKAFEVSEEDLKKEQLFEGWRSADMLDSSSRNSKQNDSKQNEPVDIQTAMQHYKIEDQNTNFENGTDPGNCPSPRSGACHRRIHSDTSTAPRIRKRDRLRRFVQGGASSSGDNRTSLTNSENSTTTQRTRKRDMLKQLFLEKESKEDKIAESRERAALLLQPEPFSKSKAIRLKELKDAKARAEERLGRSMSGDSLSGSEIGSIRSDRTSLMRSESNKTLDDFDEGGITRRNIVILVTSLIFNVALLPSKSYAQNISEQPPYLSMSSSYWADLMGRTFLSILIIIMHATSLWATINTFLVIAFDTIDFGQKHLAKNLGYGKKLYIKAVEKYSTRASLAISGLSLLVGLISSISQNILFKMCSSQSTFEFTIMPLLQAAADFILELLPGKFVWVLATITLWMELAKDSMKLVLGWINLVAYRIRIPTAFKYACILMSWAVSKLSNMIPSKLVWIWSKLSAFLFTSIPNAIMSQLNFCKEGTAPSLSWRSDAIQISSFVTMRLAVFILALLFMSYIVLPKPEKKLKNKPVKTAKPEKKQQEADSTEEDTPNKVGVKTVEFINKGNVLGALSGTKLSHRKHSRSSGSNPMEAIQE